MVVSSRKSDITRRIRSSESEVDMKLAFAKGVAKLRQPERL
jgi:hypothetical protein